MRFNIFI